MKYAFRPILWLGPAAVLAVCCIGLWGDRRRVAAAPPLSLKGYLDEKLSEAPKKESKPLADNSACYVCHGNYDGEELVLSHGKEDFGCVDCHGPSVDHRNDEANVTPPDLMYGLEDVDKLCRSCHSEHDAPAREIIERWRSRCPEKKNPNEIVCTDCHYQHRLSFRTVQWDKKTRKLITRKEAQRVKRPVGDPKQPADRSRR
jgi:formate-dependent nitrite reductase cytochrome c552 subunit